MPGWRVQAPHLPVCAQKSPRSLLRPNRPPRFHDSIIKDSPDRTPTFQPHTNLLPVSSGDNYSSSCETVAIFINMSSDYNSTILNYHVIRASTIIACRAIVPLCSPYDPLCIQARPFVLSPQSICPLRKSDASTISSPVFAFSEWLLQ